MARQWATALTAEQVCDQLGGLLDPHVLRKWARAGRVPGAFRIGRRVWFARNTASWLVVDMGAPGMTPAGYAIREPKPGSNNGFSRPP